MVNREQRDRLAVELFAFFRRQITNFEFEDRVGLLLRARTSQDFSHDRAIEAIANMAWFLYSDLEEHCLEGRHAIGGDTAKALGRWLTFLQSDQEYTWPYSNFSVIPCHWLLNLLTLGICGNRAAKKRRLAMESAGDMNTWPFLSVEDYQKAEKRFGKASW